MIDKMRTLSVTGFTNPEIATPTEKENIALTEEEKKKRFMQSVGTIQIDAEAVDDLRKRSMI